MNRLLLVTVLILGTLSLGAAARAAGRLADESAGSSDTKPGNQAIAIDNFSFSPATLTVRAGTTVVWTNHDDIPHNIAERDQKFKSKALDTDDTFSYTFANAGTYEYFCGLHPKMTGKIIVEAKQ